MKFTSVTIKISDYNENQAHLLVTTEPEMPETFSFEEFENQPCTNLAARIIGFIEQLQLREGENTGPTWDVPTIN